MSRTVALVHREVEGSLLAVQLLLAQGALALQGAGDRVVELPSPRKILLAIRAEIRNVTGMYLGPRQRATGIGCNKRGWTDAVADQHRRCADRGRAAFRINRPENRKSSRWEPTLRN
jgi:hypothetical protein